MNNDFYRAGTDGRRPQSALLLPSANLRTPADPAGYIPDEGLAAAVNVSLRLRQPLLVTGEPGTGKTQLAANVAWQLGLPAPLVFETKSDSLARDLFYRFDTLARFRDAQAGRPLNDADYLELNALGRAVLLSNPPGKYSSITPSDLTDRHPQQSVVLIDEIDKAPRDFPNDLLNEIERFYFRIPELDNIRVDAAHEFRPVVIITSNLEKGLPDAFLRRCLFYHIPSPTPTRLQAIVISRVTSMLEDAATSPLLLDAIAFFARLRTPPTSLRRPPGTSELLAWVISMLQADLDPRKTVRAQSALAAEHFCTLAKVVEDQPAVIQEFDDWLKEQTTS